MWWCSGVTTSFCLLLKDVCFAINSRLLNNELTLSPVESSRLFATIRGLFNSIRVLKAYVQNPFLCLCGAYCSGTLGRPFSWDCSCDDGILTASSGIWKIFFLKHTENSVTVYFLASYKTTVQFLFIIALLLYYWPSKM